MTNNLSVSRPKKSLNSFSLVELLVVMTIGAILAVISIGAYSKVTRAMVMTSSSQMFSGAFNLARQTAVTQNADVEFRIYQLPDYNASTPYSATVYRAFQSFLIKSGTTNALTKVNYLPSPAIISTNLTANTFLKITSPVAMPVAGSTFANPLPVYGNTYNAVVFRFSPTGGLEPTGLAALSLQAYLTIQLENDAVSGTAQLPADFAIVQIDSFNGAASVFRP